VYALSRAIHFGRFVVGQEPMPAAAASGWVIGFFLLWSVALLVCVGVLGLYIYEGERAKGNLQRRINFYERMLAWCDSGREDE